MKDADNFISVVIQGAVDNDLTPKCIKSIRQYLPNAEIILSTWDFCNITGLECDKLVLNKDPGFFYYSLNENDKINNINRQLVSTLEGLKVASKKWVLKIRTDFILNGNNFLNFKNKFEKSLDDYRVFEKKIIACSYFSRNPRCSQYVFHPSDIAFFALKKDLLNLYNIPLMTNADAYYLSINGTKYNKYVPEQYMFVNCLKKNSKIVNFSDQSDLNPSVIEETEKYFVSNFVFYSWNEFNLVAPDKFNNYLENDFLSCITHVEWLRLYKKYIDGNVIVPIKDNERIRLTKIGIDLGIIKNYKKSERVKVKKMHKLISNIAALPFYGANNKQIRNQIRRNIINKLSNKN